MISIYTRTNKLFSRERIKWEIKKFVKKKDGPAMVLESLKEGLNELNQPFQINSMRPTKIVHIISGIQALRDSIKWKKEGKIKKLIVGPNLMINPKDFNQILSSNAIDLILQPSNWVKNFYINENPKLENKIKVWPAGSSRTIKKTTRKNFCIIYCKNYGISFLKQIKEILKKKGVSFEELKYGSFNQKYFHKLLEKSSFMIYLSRSESQGLALQEAWMMNVPTLVLKSDEWTDGSNKWKDNKINAPYLISGYGEFFEIQNLREKIESIKNLNPIEKATREFSNRETTQKYLDIINSV